MVINIAFKNIDSSEALSTYATEKTDKLKKYFNGKIHVTWTFSTEKTEFVAHCHLLGNHMDYFGEASHPTLQESIDDALDKIEKQVRKHKEIVKDHLHKH
jgi:putative sigma-54 modulation protein